MPTLSPFREALAKLRSRAPVGADLSSSQWRDVPQALRDRAFFSARLVNVQIVQQIKDMVTSIIDPQQVRRADRVTPENPEGFVTEGENLASARLKIRESLKAIGYNPGDKAGTIEDLSSDARINLQLTHNVESAQGFGSFLQGQAGGALTAFPAQELFRAEDRKEERAWATRWMQAGGQVFAGRMIALKTDGIWERISAFQTPWPPFDFNSGMWIRDINRDEAVSLGLLGPDEEVKPSVGRFNASLAASVENIDPELQESLKRSFGSQIFISDGKARWAA